MFAKITLHFILRQIIQATNSMAVVKFNRSSVIVTPFVRLGRGTNIGRSEIWITRLLSRYHCSISKCMNLMAYHRIITISGATMKIGTSTMHYDQNFFVLQKSEESPRDHWCRPNSTRNLQPTMFCLHFPRYCKSLSFLTILIKWHVHCIISFQSLIDFVTNFIKLFLFI